MMKLDKQYDPLERSSSWDEVTREVINNRVSQETGDVVSFAFLSPDEGELLQKIAEVLVGLKGTDGPKIKIAAAIDKNISDKKTGVRYADNPWPGDFYRQGLAELSKLANGEDQKLRPESGRTVLEDVITGILESEEKTFLAAFLKRVLRDTTVVFYSHPTAWAEIGFPGPAYPKGYPYLNCDKKEKWEPGYNEE